MKGMKRVASTPDRLREAMADANKKQIDIARETGISHSTISRYLSGAVEPRQEAIIKLATVLNVSEWWLYGYDVPRARTEKQKKNDTLVGIVSQLRKDPEFYDVVSMLAKLPASEYASVKQIISALGKK